MINWELSCPHCGGANAVATDRVCLACNFCGAGLWVRLPDTYTTLAAPPKLKKREAVFAWDHHLKESGRPLSRSSRTVAMAYVPFWRIQAIVAVPEIIRHKSVPHDEGYTYEGRAVSNYLVGDDETVYESKEWVIKPWELTVPACPENACGLASLGIRAETFPLTGWDRIPGAELATALEMAVGKEEAVSRFERTVGSVIKQSESKVADHCHIIAPGVSLIFWPVWFLSDNAHDELRTVEIDAVSGRIIRETQAPPPESEPLASAGGESPKLLPHRCPDCGFDLEVNNREVVFPCGNCDTLVAHESRGHRSIVHARHVISDEDDHSHWYPFWGFDVDSILVPAFAIRNYRQLVRFGATVSGQNRRFSDEKLEFRALEGVTLQPDVASGLAGLIRLRRPGPLLSKTDDFVPPPDVADYEPAGHPRLIYAPLRASGAELVDPLTGLCLTRSALAAS